MSAEAPILVRSFRVGKYTATFTFRRPVKGEAHCSSVEWDPGMPKPGELSPKQLEQYRRGRNRVFAELAEITGLKVLVVDA